MGESQIYILVIVIPVAIFVVLGTIQGVLRNRDERSQSLYRVQSLESLVWDLQEEREQLKNERELLRIEVSSLQIQVRNLRDEVEHLHLQVSRQIAPSMNTTVIGQGAQTGQTAAGAGNAQS